MMKPFNIHAISFISMTLNEQYISSSLDVVAWQHVTLYCTDDESGHIVINDEDLEESKMYQILGFCRYHNIPHNITSGYLSAMPQAKYVGLDIQEFRAAIGAKRHQ